MQGRKGQRRNEVHKRRQKLQARLDGKCYPSATGYGANGTGNKRDSRVSRKRCKGLCTDGSLRYVWGNQCVGRRILVC